MDMKFFLASKTVQGLLVAALALILPRLGVDLGDPELADLAQYLLGAAGLLWAGYGRATATDKLSLLPKLVKKAGGQKGSVLPSALLLLALSALLVSLSACAATQKSPAQIAVNTGYDMATSMEKLHDRYVALHEAYAEAGNTDAVARLERIAPTLDTATAIIARHNDLVAIWAMSPDDKPSEIDELKSDILATLDVVSQALTDIATSF